MSLRPTYMSNGDNLLLQLKGNISCVLHEVCEYRMGQVLTIIDASISDQEQRKAIKDLIKNTFWSEEYISNQIAHILEQFSEKTNLGLINTDDIYRELHGLPTRLANPNKSDHYVPQSDKKWFSDPKSIASQSNK